MSCNETCYDFCGRPQRDFTAHNLHAERLTATCAVICTGVTGSEQEQQGQAGPEGPAGPQG